MIVHTDRICNNIYTFAHPDCSNRKRYCRLPKASFPIMPVPNRLVLHRKASDTTVCAEKKSPIIFYSEKLSYFCERIFLVARPGKNAGIPRGRKGKKTVLCILRYATFFCAYFLHIKILSLFLSPRKPCRCSSVGQSRRFVIRRSGVRIPPSARRRGGKARHRITKEENGKRARKTF